MSKIVYACVFLALSLGIIESGGEKLEDRWEECPANLSAYVGCQFTVHALFRSVNHSCVVGTDYGYTIRVNNIAFGDSDVSIDRVNGSERLCNISATFDVKKVDHDVHFLAVRIPLGLDVSSIKCEDILDVHNSVPSPTISNITLNCDGSLIEWTAPELVDGSAVTQYKLQIDGPNITYQITNATSMLVSYDDLLYNEEYTISIYALHCGREGNCTFGTMKTATVPQVLNHINTNMKIKNLSHAIVTFITKVITPGCRVSYPTTIAINISCDLEETLVDSRKVNVTDDGTVVVELQLPVDKVCFGSLVWKNQYFISNKRSINFDTNQLLLCSFSVDEGKISFSCEYAKGSTLQGCTVIATHLSDGRQYMNSSRSSARGGGIISGLCSGLYSLTCVGALAPTGVIRYSGTQYSTVLSVTSVSDCKGRSQTPSSLTTIQSVSVTPPAAAVHNGMRTMVISITVILPLIVLAIIVIFIATISVVIFRKKKKLAYLQDQKITASPVEVLELKFRDSSGSPIDTKPMEKIVTNDNEDTNSKQTAMEGTEKIPLSHPLSLNQAGGVVFMNTIDDGDDEHSVHEASIDTEITPPELMPEQHYVTPEMETLSIGGRRGSEKVTPFSAAAKFLRSMSLTGQETEREGRRGSDKGIPLSVAAKFIRSLSLVDQEAERTKQVREEAGPLLEHSTSEVPESSDLTPSNEKPTGEVFVGTRNPSFQSMQGSMVSGKVSQANTQKIHHASDSEHRHLISDTSEPDHSIEHHPPETGHIGVIVVSKQTTSNSEFPEKNGENDSVQMAYSRSTDQTLGTSPITTPATECVGLSSEWSHSPISSNKPDILLHRHSYSTSAASSEISDPKDHDKRDDTGHTEVIQVATLDCEQKTMIHDDQKQMSLAISDEFSIPKSESQYSVHQPHEERSQEGQAYTLIPQQTGEKT